MKHAFDSSIESLEPFDNEKGTLVVRYFDGSREVSKSHLFSQIAVEYISDTRDMDMVITLERYGPMWNITKVKEYIDGVLDNKRFEAFIRAKKLLNYLGCTPYVVDKEFNIIDRVLKK